MKEKEDSLFSLIRSLTKAQKRYIKVNNTHVIGKKNNYMMLFDALDKMDSYDEEKLLNKFKDTNFIKHLPSEKNYLFELILKNMRSYNTDRTISFTLQSLLQDIYFLSEKGLHDACNKKVKKAKKLAYKYEMFTYLLELIDWERRLMKHQFLDDINIRVKDQMVEIGEVLDLIANEKAYKELYDELFLTLKNDYYTISDERKNKLSELVQVDLLQNVELALSHSAKVYFYECWIHYYEVTGEISKCLELERSLIALWDANPDLKEEKLHKYKSAIHNLATGSYAAGDFEVFHEAMSKLRSIPARSIKEEAQHFQSIYFLELYYYLNHMEFEKAIAIAPEISESLNRYSEFINATQLLNFYYNLAVLYFMSEDMDKALEWLNKITEVKIDTRLDVQHFTRILILVVYYETSEPTVVEYIYGNTYRYLYKNERINKFERLIFTYVRKLNKVMDKKSMNELLMKLYEELEEIKREKPNTLGLEETICYILSRVNNRPMLDVLRERLELEHQHDKTS